MPTLAYLLGGFPKLGETFVLNEILEMRSQGLSPLLYALTAPPEPLVDPRAAALRPEVTYLDSSGGKLGQKLLSGCRLLPSSMLQVLRRPLLAARVVATGLGLAGSPPGLRYAIAGLWLARDLRRRGVTHIHAHFATDAAAVAHMARLAGGPPFSFSTHARDLYTTPPQQLRRRAVTAAFVVTCTECNRRYVQSLFAGEAHPPVHAIYHGTDLSRFDGARRCAEPGKIVSVGRLIPKKGYSDLVRALALLSERGTRFTCDIVASGGHLREDLGRQIATAGLAHCVKLHGPRLPDEIAAVLRCASIFVLAPVVTEDGDRDGIPNALVEAMACGVPVVSTQISGIPELVESGVDGLLVDPGNPGALADALDRLLRDASLASRLGAAGRERVERCFDLERNSARLLNLFSDRAMPRGMDVSASPKLWPRFPDDRRSKAGRQELTRRKEREHTDLVRVIEYVVD